MVPLLHSPAFLLVSELQRNIEELWPWAEEGDELVQTRRNIYWNDGGVVRVQMETLLVPSQWPRLSSSGVLTLFFRKEQVCAVLTPQTYGIRCCCLKFINCNCINLLMAFTISKGVVSWSLTAGWALTGTLLTPEVRALWPKALLLPPEGDGHRKPEEQIDGTTIKVLLCPLLASNL